MLTEERFRSRPRILRRLWTVHARIAVAKEGMGCAGIGLNLSGLIVFLQRGRKPLHVRLGNPAIVFAIDIENRPCKLLEWGVWIGNLSIKWRGGFDVGVDAGQHQGIGPTHAEPSDTNSFRVYFR